MGRELAAVGKVAHESDDGVALDSLPKEAGLFLILIGVGGILLPGPVGTPFLILGGLVFFPNAFRRFDRGLKQRFPRSHRKGMRQVHRFVVDLERRYPSRA
jgi:hypothetical protein